MFHILYLVFGILQASCPSSLLSSILVYSTIAFHQSICEGGPVLHRLSEDYSALIAPGIGFLAFVLIVLALVARKKLLDRKKATM